MNTLTLDLEGAPLNLSETDLAYALATIERRALIYTQKREDHTRVIVDVTLGITDAERLTEILGDYTPRRTKGRVRVRGLGADALVADFAPYLSPAKREKALAAVERARKAREARAAARVNAEGAA